MAIEDIQNATLQYIQTRLVQNKSAVLTPDTELIGGGLLDSVAMVELVVWVEGTYKFRVDIENLTPESFGTVGKIAEYIESHIATAGK